MEPKSISEFDESFASMSVKRYVSSSLLLMRMSKLYALYPTNPCIAWDFGRA